MSPLKNPTIWRIVPSSWGFNRATACILIIFLTIQFTFISENSNVYIINSTFFILYLFNDYVKIILSYILGGLQATSSGALHQQLDSPSSYAAFILLRAMRCLNTGAQTSYQRQVQIQTSL